MEIGFRPPKPPPGLESDPGERERGDRGRPRRRFVAAGCALIAVAVVSVVAWAVGFGSPVSAPLDTWNGYVDLAVPGPDESQTVSLDPEKSGLPSASVLTSGASRAATTAAGPRSTKIAPVAVTVNPTAAPSPNPVPPPPSTSPTPVASGGAVQVFADSYFSGPSKLLSETEMSYAANFNDKVSSVKNSTGLTICFYRDINFGGYLFHLAPYASTGWVGSGFNDAISSHAPCNK